MEHARFGDLVLTEPAAVTHDPADLDRGGVWAVVVTFEGELTAVRFDRVAKGAPPPTGAWFPPTGTWSSSMTKGEYVADGGFVVVERLLDGRRGGWAVERFVVDGTGANLPVVRGWLPEGAQPPSPPTGDLEIVASLAPGEAPDTRTDLPDGQAGTIDVGRLVNDWQGDLYNGFGFAMEESAAGADVEAGPLERVPPPLPDTSLDWRNASYAAQWYVVAVFVLWMWWRMMRQEARAARRTTDEPADTPSPETAEKIPGES